MKFWSLMSQVEDDQLIECAIHCEELGFDAVGISDHAVLPEAIASRYPGSADLPPFFQMEERWSFPEPWTALSMIAGATSRIKVMQSVYVLPLRNPIEVAKATGTLAVLSQNRVMLCAGVGWMKEEFDVYGVDFSRRGKRTDEMIAVLRKIWTGEIVEHHGEFFNFPRLRVLPAPGHVPIIAAGASAPAMRRAATLCDGWMDTGNKVEDMPPLISSLDQMRRDAGRDHLPFEIIMILNDDWDVDKFRRAQDYGVTAIQLLSPYFHYGRRSTLDEKKHYWESFADRVIWHFQ
ncbi:TIGR03619 family F420-dependent LLM class oxidoreductase [Rhizorhapis suberifaciens]|uniref:Putative F420-dependent oxidoreductase n=1 Tax=Rhizorhapis suberifaciens TaxID=13656 RepID=A0A840HZF0_9SPHN|nr:TIGR03619 family F420-dependent LLM class oxidoreductase [Rhizorhapis suberifaciens]MBB4642814.1 putative F420-dependent oxidoreductase [Rhizorhapis suberifaciens]